MCNLFSFNMRSMLKRSGSLRECWEGWPESWAKASFLLGSQSEWHYYPALTPLRLTTDTNREEESNNSNCLQMDGVFAVWCLIELWSNNEINHIYVITKYVLIRSFSTQYQSKFFKIKDQQILSRNSILTSIFHCQCAPGQLWLQCSLLPSGYERLKCKVLWVQQDLIKLYTL